MAEFKDFECFLEKKQELLRGEVPVEACFATLRNALRVALAVVLAANVGETVRKLPVGQALPLVLCLRIAQLHPDWVYQSHV